MRKIGRLRKWPPEYRRKSRQFPCFTYLLGARVAREGQTPLSRSPRTPVVSRPTPQPPLLAVDPPFRPIAYCRGRPSVVPLTSRLRNIFSRQDSIFFRSLSSARSPSYGPAVVPNHHGSTIPFALAFCLRPEGARNVPGARGAEEACHVQLRNRPGGGPAFGP